MADKVRVREFEGTEDELKDQMNRMDTIFRYNGYDPEKKGTIAMKEALDIPNASFVIPRVLTNFVQEGIEPLLIGTSLLQQIPYTPGMQTVFPAIDVLSAREVADQASLPIFNINVGGAQTFGISVQRHGLMLKISERFIQSSSYPWLQYWMRLAGNALARHKEEYIFSFITGLGTVIFDNDTAARTSGAATQPIKGITTGRDIRGRFNGSATVDDVFDSYAQLVMQGFIPDTLLMHPLTWIMFVKDPVFREFAIQAGGGSFFANFTGNPAGLSKPFFNWNGLGPGQGQVGKTTQGVLDPTSDLGNVTGVPQDLRSAPQIPGYLPTPFRVIVSPFVRFDPVNKLTDILMFNSRNLGALIVDYAPRVNQWNDPAFGISNIGIEEAYGFGIINEGQAIGVLKNVKIIPNEFVLPARTVIDIAASGNQFQVLGDITNFGASPTAVI